VCKQKVPVKKEVLPLHGQSRLLAGVYGFQATEGKEKVRIIYS
jgi:hypothetical protein